LKCRGKVRECCETAESAQYADAQNPLHTMQRGWLSGCLLCLVATSAGFTGGLSVAPCGGHARSARIRTSTIAAVSQRGELRVKLTGVGSCAPDTRVTNTDLEAFVETSDEWVTQRTGIRSRHLLAPGEALSDLAITSTRRALEHAGVDAADVDLVIMCTSTPDDLFGDAAHVALSVGASNAVAFDLTAACSGFLFGVNTAAQVTAL
jgi:3-oxoacyl-[acyl-carrier-protein] synthase-3